MYIFSSIADQKILCNFIKAQRNIIGLKVSFDDPAQAMEFDEFKSMVQKTQLEYPNFVVKFKKKKKARADEQVSVQTQAKHLYEVTSIHHSNSTPTTTTEQHQAQNALEQLNQQMSAYTQQTSQLVEISHSQILQFNPLNMTPEHNMKNPEYNILEKLNDNSITNTKSGNQDTNSQSQDQGNGQQNQLLSQQPAKKVDFNSGCGRFQQNSYNEQPAQSKYNQDDSILNQDSILDSELQYLENAKVQDDQSEQMIEELFLPNESVVDEISQTQHKEVEYIIFVNLISNERLKCSHEHIFFLQMLKQQYPKQYQQFLTHNCLIEQAYNMYQTQNKSNEIVRQELNKLIAQFSIDELKLIQTTQYAVGRSQIMQQYLSKHGLTTYFYHEQMYIIGYQVDNTDKMDTINKIKECYRGVSMDICSLDTCRQSDQSQQVNIMYNLRQQYFNQFMAVQFKELCFNHSIIDKILLLECNVQSMELSEQKDIFIDKLQNYIRCYYQALLFINIYAQQNNHILYQLYEQSNLQIECNQLRCVLIYQDCNLYILGVDKDIETLFTKLIKSPIIQSYDQIRNDSQILINIDNFRYLINQDKKVERFDYESTINQLIKCQIQVIQKNDYWHISLGNRSNTKNICKVISFLANQKSSINNMEDIDFNYRRLLQWKSNKQLVLDNQNNDSLIERYTAFKDMKLYFSTLTEQYTTPSKNQLELDQISQARMKFFEKYKSIILASIKSVISNYKIIVCEESMPSRHLLISIYNKITPEEQQAEYKKLSEPLLNLYYIIIKCKSPIQQSYFQQLSRVNQILEDYGSGQEKYKQLASVLSDNRSTAETSICVLGGKQDLISGFQHLQSALNSLNIPAEVFNSITFLIDSKNIFQAQLESQQYLTEQLKRNLSSKGFQVTPQSDPWYLVKMDRSLAHYSFTFIKLLCEQIPDLTPDFLNMSHVSDKSSMHLTQSIINPNNLSDLGQLKNSFDDQSFFKKPQNESIVTKQNILPAANNLIETKQIILPPNTIKEELKSRPQERFQTLQAPKQVQKQPLESTFILDMPRSIIVTAGYSVIDVYNKQSNTPLEYREPIVPDQYLQNFVALNKVRSLIEVRKQSKLKLFHITQLIEFRKFDPDIIYFRNEMLALQEMKKNNRNNIIMFLVNRYAKYELNKDEITLRLKQSDQVYPILTIHQREY